MTKIPNFENSRWRMAAILKIVLSLYLSRKSFDLNEIWYADADYTSRVGYIYTINTKYKYKYQNYMTKTPNFENSRWRMAAILKMVLSLYFSRKSSDLNEIWYAGAD